MCNFLVAEESFGHPSFETKQHRIDKS